MAQFINTRTEYANLENMKVSLKALFWKSVEHQQIDASLSEASKSAYYAAKGLGAVIQAQTVLLEHERDLVERAAHAPR